MRERESVTNLSLLKKGSLFTALIAGLSWQTIQSFQAESWYVTRLPPFQHALLETFPPRSQSYQDEVQLGCAFACSPKCAAEAADPRGRPAASPGIAIFHPASVRPDQRLKDAAEKAAQEAARGGSPATDAFAMAAGDQAAPPRQRARPPFPREFLAFVNPIPEPAVAVQTAAPPPIWAQVVAALPDTIRTRLLANKKAAAKRKAANKKAPGGQGPAKRGRKAASAGGEGPVRGAFQGRGHILGQGPATGEGNTTISISSNDGSDTDSDVVEIKR